MDFYTDEELARMERGEQTRAPLAPPQVPLYPLALAQTPPNGGAAPNGQPPPAAGPMGLATKQLGPLPVWAWLLIGGGVAGTGYFFWKSQRPKKNDGGSDDSSASPKLGDVLSMNAAPPSGSRSSWEPSRSAFAEKLQRYFDKKGHAQHVRVWHDAEDARDKGKLRVISPLVNVQVTGGAVKVDTALQRWARREGLNPVQHQDGSIGFYPHTGKRGKEWESYIDALRDDGQSI